MEQNVKIKEDAKGVIFLESAGVKLICPFRNPFMMPGRMQGNVEIHEKTCNSICPHFRFNTDDVMMIKYVNLTCGGLAAYFKDTFDESK